MKKTGILVLVLVLALGSLGVGYAAWSDLLTINSWATTGELDADFTGHVVVTDSDGNQLNGGYVEHAYFYMDDYGKFIVKNAYPGYSASATFTIENTGSIPIDTWLSFTEQHHPWGTPGNVFTISDAGSNNLLPGHSFPVTVTLTIPETWGNMPGDFDDMFTENEQFSATFKISVEQYDH